MVDSSDVIIIGCGISGICCALKLHSLGYNVVILEARNQLGGRTSSVHFKQNNLEFNIGAAWIHGSNNNPIVNLVKEYGITTKDNNGQIGILDHLYIPPTEEKDKLNNELSIEEKNELKKYFEEIRIKYINYFNKQQEKNKPNKSILDILLLIFKEDKKLSDIYHSNTRIGKSLVWLMNQIGQYEATSLNNIKGEKSSLNLGNESDDKIVITYAKLIENMSKIIPKENIHLSEAVLSINYSNKNQFIKVKTNKNKIYQTKKLVCTVSLGVLKKEIINFIPRLPYSKQKAIKQIGFGVMNKIILHFSECFWDSSCHSFGIITGNFPYWLNHYKICNKPVIIGLISGDFIMKIQKENWSDDKILQNALHVLTVTFNIDLPLLKEHYITHWENEIYIGGSYSYSHKLTSENDFNILSEPIDNKLYFAGEHTSTSNYGYVHGGVNSGLREAERIHESFTNISNKCKL